DVIRLHTATPYTVYAIGFVPGFPYLGYLPPELCGVGRLPSPRVRVEPGSVGLTGRQTGIYPLARPGGWNLIGRTPLTVVDVADGFFPLRVGDAVASSASTRGDTANWKEKGSASGGARQRGDDRDQRTEKRGAEAFCPLVFCL